MEIPTLDVMIEYYLCGRKIRHTSDSAKISIEEMNAEGRGIGLEIYPCKYGNHFHTGNPTTSTSGRRARKRLVDHAKKQWKKDIANGRLALFA